jgi:carbon starvation protein
MNTLLMCVIVFVLYIIAYNTYGKFLAKKIFDIDPDRTVPSVEFNDGVDYVPTKKEVLFGHHYTSIAGLGPIVGPAIAIIWGWVPALLWVLLGSIFAGALHDFGSLVVSVRNKGQSIGELATGLISPRVRTLFLLIIFFELWIVIAIFALIIAILFVWYPQAVFPVWFEIPIAVWLGYMVYKKNKNVTWLAVIAVIAMYVTIIIGAYWPLKMPGMLGLNAIEIWIIILFIYAFIASTLPVTSLLQPRDYINAHELIIMLALMFIGVIVAHPAIVAPAFNLHAKGAPPVWPFLFVVIACGAISGFHSLVSSGTSSKQLANERDAQFVGYGSMLMEGTLSTLVIAAVAGGLGMALVVKGQTLTGVAAFTQHYASWAAAAGLKSKLSAVIFGAANMMEAYGIPKMIAITIMGVFMVSFASTTLDTATRVQRYIVSELTTDWNLDFLSGRYVATFIAVGTAVALAFYSGNGKGALRLWPLFGTVNQLLAALTLLVITVYLAKKGKSLVYSGIPLIFMLFMTGWAMILNLEKFYAKGDWFLFIVGLIVFVLEIWMVIESAIVLGKPNQEASGATGESSAS